MHRKVAADFRPATATETLEIGAGTLNHLKYEASSMYDIVEPVAALYQDSPFRDRVRIIFTDVRNIPKERRYDRIISIAAFEHICDLPFVVARAALLLRNGGSLRVAIPSEGTLLWRLGWTFTTGVEFRLKYGLDYSVVMRHEHINTSTEIAEILNYFFSQTRVQVFGIARPLSFYQFYECRLPRVSNCDDYLKFDDQGSR
jgi:hypothetical protein